MAGGQKQLVLQALFFGAMGLFLFGFVCLAPHPGSLEGKSLFFVARSSAWRNLGDWPAAWCSLEIILLNIGVLFVLFALGMLLVSSRPVMLRRLLAVLAFVPCLGLWLGLFYLVRAVL